MNAASRDSLKKEMSFMKIHNDFNYHARVTDEVGVRRQIMNDLTEYGMHEEIPIDVIMQMDVFSLHEMVELRKLHFRMHVAASRIQAAFRLYVFRKFCRQKYYREFKAARKIQAQWKTHRIRRFVIALGQGKGNHAA